MIFLQIPRNRVILAAHHSAFVDRDAGELRLAPQPPSSSRTLAPMSACFINDSPTRMAWAPHFASRSTSARVWMPLSATRRGDLLLVACCVLPEEERTRAASRSVVARSTLKVAKSRLFTPISSAPALTILSSKASPASLNANRRFFQNPFLNNFYRRFVRSKEF